MGRCVRDPPGRAVPWPPLPRGLTQSELSAGADLARMFEIVIPPEAGGAIVLPRDLDLLDAKIAETGASLVIVNSRPVIIGSAVTGRGVISAKYWYMRCESAS